MGSGSIQARWCLRHLWPATKLNLTRLASLLDQRCRRVELVLGDEFLLLQRLVDERAHARRGEHRLAIARRVRRDLRRIRAEAHHHRGEHRVGRAELAEEEWAARAEALARLAP